MVYISSDGRVLQAKPWAKYCIDVARLREKRGW